MDTAAKRYSAINVACPWRGTNIVPDVTFPVGERQAAAFMYSGIDSGGGGGATLPLRTLLGAGF